MEKAIKKAINGGYKGCTDAVWNESTLLDPLFWQALGKAEGWGKTMTSRSGVRMRDIYTVYWHDFVDHLAEGKDINSFFEDLLTNKENKQ